MSGWKCYWGESNETRKTKIEKKQMSQDALIVPRSLRCVARRAEMRRGGKSRATPVGMTWKKELTLRLQRAQSSQRRGRM